VIPGKKYTPSDFVAMFWRRKWLIVLPLTIVSVGTFFFARSLQNRYRAETLILVVPQRVPENYVKATVTSRIEDRLNSISQQILSRTRLERIIQDFDLYAEKRRTVIMEDVVEQMRKDIDVLVIKGDAFKVAYMGDEPRTVMQVTQRLASLFIDENLRDRETLAEQSYQFLDAQLEDARRRLVEHEKKLEEYRRRYSGAMPSQLQSNLQVIQNTQMQIQALNESMSRDRDRRLMIERAIADAPQAEPAPPAGSAAPAAPGEPVGGTVLQQIEAARQVLHQLELRLKPEHPDVMRVKRSIASLEQKAAVEALQKTLSADVTAPLVTSPGERIRANRLAELRTELENLDRQFARKEAEEKQLRQVTATYQARIESTPARESELTELMRDYETLQKTYTSFLTKKEDSKVAANLERNQIGEQFKVLDVARMPEKPDSPNRIKIDALGVLFGLALGLGLVALLEVSDSTLKTDDDVVVALSLPVLAAVPILATTSNKKPANRRRWILAGASTAAAVLIALVLLVWKLGLSGIGV
jgi:polysaccharide chain length determinant protein (PEP-CTERM system associated)